MLSAKLQPFYSDLNLLIVLWQDLTIIHLLIDGCDAWVSWYNGWDFIVYCTGVSWYMYWSGVQKYEFCVIVVQMENAKF